MWNLPLRKYGIRIIYDCLKDATDPCFDVARNELEM
jgi:hypothetical protein